MAYTDREKSFYDSAADEYIVRNNLPQKNVWDSDQWAAFIRHMARVIIANPHIFSQENIERAQSQVGYYAADKAADGILDKVGLFFGEFANQGNRINPFSEENFNKTIIITGVAIVVVSAVVAYVVTPKILTK